VVCHKPCVTLPVVAMVNGTTALEGAVVTISSSIYRCSVLIISWDLNKL